MFFSPCSLRSAQCATLIALATVAGVSRFESREPSTPPPGTDTSTTTLVRCAANRYLISLLAASRHLPTTATPTRIVLEPIAAFEPPADIAVPPPPCDAIDAPPRPASVVLPTPQVRAFPFAIGPPPRGSRVSCRPVAPVSAGVVRFDFRLVSLDRLMGGRSVPNPGANPLPSYALRGEPKPFFRSSTCALRRPSGPPRRAERKDFLFL